MGLEGKRGVVRLSTVPTSALPPQAWGEREAVGRRTTGVLLQDPCNIQLPFQPKRQSDLREMTDVAILAMLE